MSDQLVFLVTGASSGLGRHLSQAILAAGHKVVATMRRPERSPEVVAEVQRNSNGVCIPLDVTADDLESRMEECIRTFGRVDVLINNAGYGYGGALEDCTMAEIRRNMETNFFGALRTMKAVIPHMRQRGGGTIINITSTEGISAVPSLSVYAAGKHALEGASEALAGELAAFGIRVIIAEPGGMRTEFLSPNNVSEPPMSDAYKQTIVEAVLNRLRTDHGNQMLDPERCAKAIVNVVVSSGSAEQAAMGKFLRLPLGREMLDRISYKMQLVKENMGALEGIAKSCDFDA